MESAVGWAKTPFTESEKHAVLYGMDRPRLGFNAFNCAPLPTLLCPLSTGTHDNPPSPPTLEKLLYCDRATVEAKPGDVGDTLLGGAAAGGVRDRCAGEFFDPPHCRLWMIFLCNSQYSSSLQSVECQDVLH